MTFGCQHKHLGIGSLNGKVTCPDCFAEVDHPYYVNKFPLKRERVETGIERTARESEHEWLRQMGVKP